MFLEGCSRLIPFTGGPSWMCMVLSCAATLLSTGENIHQYIQIGRAHRWTVFFFH